MQPHVQTMTDCTYAASFQQESAHKASALNGCLVQGISRCGDTYRSQALRFWGLTLSLWDLLTFSQKVLAGRSENHLARLLLVEEASSQNGIMGCHQAKNHARQHGRHDQLHRHGTSPAALQTLRLLADTSKGATITAPQCPTAEQHD